MLVIGLVSTSALKVCCYNSDVERRTGLRDRSTCTACSRPIISNTSVTSVANLCRPTLVKHTHTYCPSTRRKSLDVDLYAYLPNITYDLESLHKHAHGYLKVAQIHKRSAWVAKGTQHLRGVPEMKPRKVYSIRNLQTWFRSHTWHSPNVQSYWQQEQSLNASP